MLLAWPVTVPSSVTVSTALIELNTDGFAELGEGNEGCGVGIDNFAGARGVRIIIDHAFSVSNASEGIVAGSTALMLDITLAENDDLKWEGGIDRLSRSLGRCRALL